MSSSDRDSILSNITLQLDYKNFDKADIIIEAVFEDINIKHKVLQEIEAVIRPDCIFASNTSALPISKIAAVSKRPENVIGMHYFSPVEKMDLLEIVVTDKTSKDVTSTAVEVGLRQGKTVIVVKDGPGFYTTRILAGTLSEIFELLREGIDPIRIDSVMTKFGFPVGPIQLLDEVGIDVGFHVSKDLGSVFKDRMGTDVSVLEVLIKEHGILGKKNNKGFFTYDEKKKRGALNPVVMNEFNKNKLPGEHNLSDEDLAFRLAGKLVNEAVYCLQEGIIDNPVDGDIGAVFGLGFPPFHGGPFRFVDTLGADKIVSKMQNFVSRYGKRFAPAPLLVEHAKNNKKFHKD